MGKKRQQWFLAPFLSLLRRRLITIVILILGGAYWITVTGCSGKVDHEPHCGDGLARLDDEMTCTPREMNTQTLALPELPNVGDLLDHLPESRFVVLVNSASIAPAYKIDWNGATYTIAVSKSTGAVVFISTEAKGFRTPEGFSMDNTIGDLMVKYPDGIRKEPGWGSYVMLPSGWAAFEGVEGKFEATSKIRNFFRK